MIYLSSPDVTVAEEEAVVRAIRSGWIAPLGPEVDAFERELADYTGRPHAVALSSGTAALHLGLLALGVGPGDVVACSSMTFAATANAIVYAGAEPLFVDSDLSGNMNPDLLEAALEQAEQRGWRVAAVVPVDLFGRVVDHARIDGPAAERGIPVLCDAAESLGSTYHGRSSCAYGDLAAVSFNGNKVMTSSGGGALFTDSAETAERVRYLATQARRPARHYEHTEIGYNYRLSNVLAALGRAQLARLDEMIERRRRLRARYQEALSGVPGISFLGMQVPSGVGTADNCWLTSIIVDPDLAGFTHLDLCEALAGAGVESRPLWKPMHLQPVFAGAAAVVDGTAERLFARGLSLPSGSVITTAEAERIVELIREVVDRAA